MHDLGYENNRIYLPVARLLSLFALHRCGSCLGFSPGGLGCSNKALLVQRKPIEGISPSQISPLLRHATHTLLSEGVKGLVRINTLADLLCQWQIHSHHLHSVRVWLLVVGKHPASTGAKKKGSSSYRGG